MSNNKVKFNNKNSTDDLSTVMILLIVLGIMLVVFVGIMVYINYKKYNQYKIQDFVEAELLAKIHNCRNKLLTIDANKIPSSSLGNEYSLNMWLYINSYDYKYGEPKYILMKGSTNHNSGYYNNSNPGIYLDKTLNDIVINLELQSGNSDSLTPSPSGMVSYASCRVNNIPLQRWVCLHLSLYNNMLDVYMDGKLYKSCIFKGFPKPNNEPMFLGFDGGFDGYVSRITWANKNLSPDEIYAKYEQGPKILGDPWESMKTTLGLGEDENTDGNTDNN